MHTVIVLGGGFGLFVACLLLGHAWGNGLPGLVTGAKIFIPLWLVCAGVNMWIGTTRGYSWAEEFPIFLGIFAVPVVVASLVWWKLA